MGRKKDKKVQPNEEDLALFRESVGNVRPLNSPPRASHEKTRPAPRPLHRQQDDRDAAADFLRAAPDEDIPEASDELSYLRPGYQKRYLSRLKRGQYSIQDEFDLHGMNEKTAAEALLSFMQECQAGGLRCVRVIHGKGLRSSNGPRLKILVNRLLRRHEAVIAFASCRPTDGGTGAVAVLVKGGD